MENYVKAKQDITKNQTKEDYCVLNAEDPYTDAFLEQCPATVILFSSQRELADGYFYADECIYKAVQGKKQKLMNIHEMRLLGMHNVENVMAAIAMADAYGADMEVILNVVRDFKAVEHRIEYVKTVRGVDYYNDSKGTNPDAAIKGIGAMVKPTYLIGGGYDKQSEYDEWIESFGGKVRKLVLLGQTREKIADCAKSMVLRIIFLWMICSRQLTTAQSMQKKEKRCCCLRRVRVGGCSRITKCAEKCLRIW